MWTGTFCSIVSHLIWNETCQGVGKYRDFHPKPITLSLATGRSESVKGARIMREKIKLVSSAGTGYFYTTRKNKRKTPDKLRLKKYDPVVRKHVEFVEAKIK